MKFGESETKMELLNKVVAVRSEEVPGKSEGACMHVVSVG